MKYFLLPRPHNLWSKQRTLELISPKPLVLSDFAFSSKIVSKDGGQDRICISAFTLIELTITLALIVCLVSISLPVILNTSRLYVANQARNLQATCWALEQQAIAQNKQIELYLNQAANFYVWAEQVVKLAPKVKFGVIDGVLGPPSSPQKEIQRAVTFAENKIIFYPDGRISPGSVYLVDDMNRILYAVTVSVASVSYVRLYRYVNNHWHQFT